MKCSPPGSSVLGILQARTLGWVAISSSGGLPNPGMEPSSPALAGGFLSLSHQGSPINGISALIQETALSSQAPSAAWGCHVRIQGEVCVWAQGPHLTMLVPYSNFQAPEPWAINLLLSRPVYGVLLKQPEQAQSLIRACQAFCALCYHSAHPLGYNGQLPYLPPHGLLPPGGVSICKACPVPGTLGTLTSPGLLAGVLLRGSKSAWGDLSLTTFCGLLQG